MFRINVIDTNEGRTKVYEQTECLLQCMQFDEDKGYGK